ncbi:MAG: Hsp20/alpha crystallin family protein [Calditrichaeota bacterium]|nr:Hsp20/alpha crystallin family protein [Calditrichota bacterium]
MPMHVIRIVRELSDSGSSSGTNAHIFCEETSQTNLATWEPNTDIFESEDQVIIRMELAGIARKDISVKLKNGKLLISGIRRENRPQKQVYFHRLDIHYGRFLKIISIPESIEHNDIEAHFQEGILEITISKTSQVIEIPIAVEINLSE